MYLIWLQSAQARSLESYMVSAQAASARQHASTPARQRELASWHIPPNVPTQRRGWQLALSWIDSIRNKQLNHGIRFTSLMSEASMFNERATSLSKPRYTHSTITIMHSLHPLILHIINLAHGKHPIHRVSAQGSENFVSNCTRSNLRRSKKKQKFLGGGGACP